VFDNTLEAIVITDGCGRQSRPTPKRVSCSAEPSTFDASKDDLELYLLDLTMPDVRGRPRVASWLDCQIDSGRSPAIDIPGSSRA